MNINELEELAKEWDRLDADNEYSKSFLELIAAYREAVAALKKIRDIDDELNDACWIAVYALDTAKRLGVEL